MNTLYMLGFASPALLSLTGVLATLMGYRHALTVRILTALPQKLFVKKFPSFYCSYKFYEYSGNP